MNAQVVTISATFGAGGPAVGPAVAERLGLPFVDRAIPELVAGEIGCTLEEALAHDDRAESGIGRILAGAARLPTMALGMDVYFPDHTAALPGEFVEHTESVIKRTAERGGGVLLGRAAGVVLAGHRGALHVRLDGPRERRLARAAAEMPSGARAAESGRPAEAGRAAPTRTPDRDVERMLDDNDRARTAYVKHFYGVDPADPRLYHLVIDTTRLSVSATVELIVVAAREV
ncbi:cytidylate kinase-like family protein [Actinomadura sp. 7K507]|uniref:cytidylate kinase-like family protein n=1 Tax=Actinomadura sp. 7K507 TaxID=2530365 RepID=UPI00104B46E8|nr:cytidylate kinase-like family protein [Actinomadura sp. 7K507]TDC94298.1 cytidylate kinase-like family protein [Actinomadura sp. 7K507]